MARAYVLFILGTTCTCAIGGCGSTSSGGGGSSDPLTDGNRGAVPPDAVGKFTGEPNDAFEQALTAVLTSADRAALQGHVAEGGDIDVYGLGPLAAGDRLTISVTTPSDLDAAIALYDAEQRLVNNNDDVNYSAGLLDPYIEHVVRHDGEVYYLAISYASGADAAMLTGNYRIDVTVDRGGEVPAPAGQTLLLDFDGGETGSPNLLIESVGPFDAGDVDPMYEDDTELIKSVIIQTMIENFAGYNITLRTTDDPNPIDGEYSTIWFGGLSAIAFGVSEAVDLYNADACDDGVIFTETFKPQAFGFPPSTEQLGVAIGNVAAHEAGHLLGLNHVNDPDRIMDAASPAYTFIRDQTFGVGPLSPEIMRLGVQDAALLLAETLGPP